MEIRPMLATDWPEVARIYREGIATGFATFETEAPQYEAWNRAHLPECRLVAEQKGSVLGWAALSPVSGRCVYGGVAEVSIYIGDGNRGKGIGMRLMEHLIRESEAAGLWTLQSGIFPENEASIRLHEKAGFRRLGYREKVALHQGVWKDNVLFERRSPTVGL
ncbi:GNAT family N-acetyltransferase [Robiginitalea sp. M366]|uniref:GNAT family N-acetyltransferase n=1 Tax=Robiginitalea aestuariiviva TaxID=3036903 RepID=UPI00240DAA31|nr:GNAT family N-acetyltransferase [Robiginitalea aestuariiviva]MDG1571201.1 GNAT family N-acetyltransferase [Robiginitalea aestuariiviva]